MHSGFRVRLTDTERLELVTQAITWAQERYGADLEGLPVAIEPLLVEQARLLLRLTDPA
jgi:hypothetical protein